MYKLSYSKENINVNKLHDELVTLDLPYFLTHNETEVFFSFPDVKREETEVMDGETVIDTVVTFKKRVESTVMETDEEGNEVEKKVTEWVDFDFAPIQAKIDEAIANHDPTPAPTPPTETERLEALEVALTEVILNGQIPSATN